MSSLNYIAILGRQPELGLVELESILGARNLRPFGQQAALLSRPADIARLGGSVKVGRVIAELAADEINSMLFDGGVWDEVLKVARQIEGKVTFGLSVYGGRKSAKDVQAAAAKELKARLAQIVNGSVRAVTSQSRGRELSAAQVKFNKLLAKGFELLVVYNGKDAAVVALTIGVQDIDWYSKRDYDRPARSAKVGMLPPKLAQVLVNTTHAPVVADPFCGTGVVLQEALLNGREACGSDLSAEMVAATRENLPWLAGQVSTPLPDWAVAKVDARKVILPENCAVVSEGYLGPNLVHSPAPSELAKIRAELLDLYRAALANFARQLPSGGEVSICVPAWRVNRRWQYLGLVDELGALGYTLKRFEHAHTPLLYAREGQVVGRQLLLLRKK